MTRPALAVFSHLPWAFVWQRPQHLISRLGPPGRTWFVEECRAVSGCDSPTIRVEPDDPVTRVWLELPPDTPGLTQGPPVPGEDAHFAGFCEQEPELYAGMVAELLGPDPERTVWAYTPMALPLIERLERSLLVYDVMDDLEALAYAPPALRDNQARLLAQADVVLAGGRSIQAGVAARTEAEVHLFASGVEPEHFAPAQALRRPRERPVAGYVGVIDERLDLDLVAELALRLPRWDVELVGPVFKIAPEDLPRAPNLRYPGMRRYEELPEVLAGFDVALMPFRCSQVTRSLSPTKTLEYLAAGLPVVSTPLPDVVAGYRGVVELAEDGPGFAAACRRALAAGLGGREDAVRALLHAHHWDTIAARIQDRLDAARPQVRAAPR